MRKSVTYKKMRVTCLLLGSLRKQNKTKPIKRRTKQKTKGKDKTIKNEPTKSPQTTQGKTKKITLILALAVVGLPLFFSLMFSGNNLRINVLKHNYILI